MFLMFIIDVNTKQEKPTKGQKHGDDPKEDRAETEDQNLDSKELSRGGSKPEDELMAVQGIAVSTDAKPLVEKIENSEIDEGLVKMNTQVKDSLETKVTQPENSQSKGVAGDVKDPLNKK
ncbi:UNVERIFIED_CONTAM: hypothetical protein FKN15_049199 [Acipenser sinensis]